MELSRENQKGTFGRMKTLMQQQIINEEAMNSGSSLKKVSNLNSKSEGWKYHAWKQAPQGFIAAVLPLPENSRMFTSFIIYILHINSFHFQHSFQK